MPTKLMDKTEVSGSLSARFFVGLTHQLRFCPNVVMSGMLLQTWIRLKVSRNSAYIWSVGETRVWKTTQAL